MEFFSILKANFLENKMLHETFYFKTLIYFHEKNCFIIVITIFTVFYIKIIQLVDTHVRISNLKNQFVENTVTAVDDATIGD